MNNFNNPNQITSYNNWGPEDGEIHGEDFNGSSGGYNPQFMSGRGGGMMDQGYRRHQQNNGPSQSGMPSFISSNPPPPPMMISSPSQGSNGSAGMANPEQPNVIFIGDLSFFCREQHLIELFSQYGRVVKCSIVLNDAHTKSLMYGFVTMATHPEAATVASRFNNQLFMGRTMKIELLKETKPAAPKPPTYLNGFQIHVSFASSFSLDQVIVPNETFLRKFFCRYGLINDVIIRDYTVQSGLCKQEGFGFVTFENEMSAVAASQECAMITLEGIAFKCKLCTKGARNPIGGSMMGGRQAPQYGFPNDFSGHQGGFGEFHQGGGFGGHNRSGMAPMHSMSLPPPTQHQMGYSNRSMMQDQSIRNPRMHGDSNGPSRNSGYQVIPPDSFSGMNNNRMDRNQFGSDFSGQQIGQQMFQQQQQSNQLRQAAMSFQQRQHPSGNFGQSDDTMRSNLNNRNFQSNAPVFSQSNNFSSQPGMRNFSNPNQNIANPSNNFNNNNFQQQYGNSQRGGGSGGGMMGFNNNMNYQQQSPRYQQSFDRDDMQDNGMDRFNNNYNNRFNPGNNNFGDYSQMETPPQQQFGNMHPSSENNFNNNGFPGRPGSGYYGNQGNPNNDPRYPTSSLLNDDSYEFYQIDNSLNQEQTKSNYLGESGDRIRGSSVDVGNSEQPSAIADVSGRKIQQSHYPGMQGNDTLDGLVDEPEYSSLVEGDHPNYDDETFQDHDKDNDQTFYQS